MDGTCRTCPWRRLLPGSAENRLSLPLNTGRLLTNGGKKHRPVVDWAHERPLETPDQLAYPAGRGISDGITEIVTHAEPDGVCQVARYLCREKAIPLKLHFLNFKYLRGAFENRSRDVLRDGDRAIFIHDGKSKGTSNEVKLAEKMNVPYTYHQLGKTEHKSSVGFDITQDWGADLEPLELPEIPKLA